MLKKRMLLLVASVAAFGAVMVSGAFANNAGSTTVTGANNVVRSVQGDVTARLTGQTGVVWATGLPVKIADIEAYQSTAGYNIRARGTTVPLAAISVGSCGTNPVQYTTTEQTGPYNDVQMTGSWAKVGELSLNVSPDATPASCSITGAVVTVNYEVW